jgi:hypothetical protein
MEHLGPVTRRWNNYLEKVGKYLNFSFGIFLLQNNSMLWNDLVEKIIHVQLNDQDDVFI